MMPHGLSNSANAFWMLSDHIATHRSAPMYMPTAMSFLGSRTVRRPVSFAFVNGLCPPLDDLQPLVSGGYLTGGSGAEVRQGPRRRHGEAASAKEPALDVANQ